MSALFLGIDTSNYTTSIAMATAEGEIICNIKKLLPVAEGACGLRQSDALFAHTKALPIEMRNIAPLLKEGAIVAVGVSDKPRAREGSYMPCFLAGLSAAEGVALGANVPLYRVSHQCGHFMAAIYSARADQLLDGRDFLGFHISGGTTEMLYARFENNAFVSSIVGGTADISCGQLIDRVSLYMGLAFPGGAKLEQYALQNDKKIPSIRIKCTDGKVNLSGFENQLKQEYDKTHNIPYVAAYTLAIVGKAIETMLHSFNGFAHDLPVLFSGGVMSCKWLQSKLGALCEGYFAQPAFSSDNAAGVALLARYAHLHGGQ